MSEREFFDLVVSMREAQSRYFRTRSTNDLQDARKAERAVDQAIADRQDQQGKLF